jgi:hypothetical protein
VDFIVTTLTGMNRAIICFYSQHGAAEQWIKEGKEATHWTRLLLPTLGQRGLACPSGRSLTALGTLLRRLVRPVAIQGWSLTSLPQPTVQDRRAPDPAGAVLVLQLAESYLTGPLFRQILARIERLAGHPT